MADHNTIEWPAALPPPVHQRTLKIITRPLDEDTLYVTGRLLDERLLANCSWWAHLRPKGPIHDFEVNLLLKGQPPEIVKARAFMHTFPHAPCAGLYKTAEDLVGLKVTTGFLREVQKKMGGIRGCAHITHLVTVMAPAIIQGQMNAKALIPQPVPESLESQPELSLIIGTCKVWAEDSPTTAKLRDEIKRLNTK